MSDKTLSEEYLSDQMEVLGDWPPDEWEDAQDLSQALTEPQREAVWTLYDKVEDLVWKVTRRQLQSTDDVEPEEMEGALPIIFLRTLASYDHDQSHLTTWIWREGRRHARREIKALTGQSEQDRRIERALSKLYVTTQQEEGRAPTTEEKVEYLRDHVAHARQISREALVDSIADIEEQALRTRSLDESTTDDGEKTLAGLIPAGSPDVVDIDAVGRRIAEETDRIELWERLQGEEPTSRSFSDAQARVILLERRARGADAEQIAWEHQTSPYVVQMIDQQRGPYQVDVTDDEVERYAISQGYDELEEERGHSRARALTDEEALEIRRRYEEWDYTYPELADEYDTSTATIGDAVNAKRAYSHLDEPQLDPRTALDYEEAVEVRERYDEGATYQELADEYDVSITTIAHAVRGESPYSVFDAIETRTGGHDRALSDDEAMEVQRRYANEDVSYNDLASAYDVEKTTILRAVRAERNYDHLDPNTDSVTESEDSDMDTQKLQAKIDRLTRIIERASEDLPISTAEEIRQHFDELELTREQLQGVHECSAVTIERVLVGEGYDDFDDLTA